MTINLINLPEADFPLIISKRIKSLEGLENIINNNCEVIVDLAIKKVSKTKYLVNGNISSTLEIECYRCSNLTDVSLNISTNILIKDKQEEKFDTKWVKETHYQDLSTFNIEQLILEEIHLNFPSEVICCSKSTLQKLPQIKKRKTRPFKKIRDLIK